MEIGIDQNAQIAAFVMVQFLGIPFAFLFGALGTRIGTKRALFIALALNIEFIGLQAQDLNLVTAVLVAIALMLPMIKRRLGGRRGA